MWTFINCFKTLKSHTHEKTVAIVRCQDFIRNFADKSSSDKTKSSKSALQGTENELRLRVRRARPADVPRVLRYVREHAKHAWPGLVSPQTTSNKILGDYVARTLAQGHSMLAEQQEVRRGWSQIRGLALGAAVCPWDASMLEKWARCVRCMKSRRLMNFTAYCLRAPALHDKYHVHNILQILVIVPPESPKNTEIVQTLAKNSILRGKDAGFPVIRFDVTSDVVAKSLESLQLKKEWQFIYDSLPEPLDIQMRAQREPMTNTNIQAALNTNKGHFIAVYTAFTKTTE